MTAFINLERGLRQGCPLSMPYILTAQVIATHLRANKQIQRLKLPNSDDKVKLSQDADDTTLLLANDNSIKECFKIFESYEKASGTKINVEKMQRTVDRTVQRQNRPAARLRLV